MSRIALLVVAAVLAAVAPASAADWTNWRGPYETGYSKETGLPSDWSPAGKNLVWKGDFGSRSTPLVMKGRVFVFNYTAEKFKDPQGNIKDKPETIQERVMCLDADTGKLIWEHTFPIFHTDIVTVRLGWTNMVADPATGYVFVHGTQGFLICLDGMANQAKVVWQRSLTEEYGRITGYGGRVTSPSLYGDTVIIGMLNSSWGDHAKGGHRFVAYDKKTGSVRWWSEPAGAVKDTYYSVPVIATVDGVDLLVSGGADGSVFAMNARTGVPQWRYVFGTTAVNCSPVVQGNYVYIGHGEENPDNNIQGRVICLDMSKIVKGEPTLVWKKDGLKARYTSPIIHKDRLYVADEIGKLFCLDAMTGTQIWKYSYGRDARGSPVLADGKIYVGEVNSRFHILEAGEKKCTPLSNVFFPAANGAANVEVNGSAAVANGRVYFATSDEFYCIGSKEPVFDKPGVPLPPAVPPVLGPLAHLQINPAEVVVHPGDTVKFTVRGFDAKGNALKDVVDAEWSLPAPPLPKGAKSPPPALDGDIKGGVLTIGTKKPVQQGYVAVKVGDVVGKARVRVAPKLPFTPNFANIPVGAGPSGWVNTQGKFVVDTLNGKNVLRKVNDNPSPLVARGIAFIGEPTLKDYTIECDVQTEMVGTDLGDMGVVANRYSLILAGNIQKLRLVTWDALPRLDVTVPFKIQPGVWYRLKLTTDAKTGSVMGKAWPATDEEPAAWTLQLNDPRFITEGSPGIYGYVTGFVGGNAGTNIYYDKLSIK